jgi:hypothetical protein
MGLRVRPNNYVKSNSYDDPFFCECDRRFGFSLSLVVATRDHARVYLRLPYIRARKGGPRASRRGWILARSATPWGAGAHQGKIGFSLPRRRVPLHFEDAKATPRKGKSSSSKRWGLALRVGIQGERLPDGKRRRDFRDRPEDCAVPESY